MAQESNSSATPPQVYKGERRVVITGVGVVTPLALDVPEFWKRLTAGESGVGKITLVDTTEYKVHFAGEVYDFSLEGITDPREEKRLDRFTQFAVHAGHQAILDSKLDFDSIDRTRCGVILGSGIGGLVEIENQIERMLTKGPSRVSPFTVPKMMVNAAGGTISITYGLKGPNYAVATACASATNAMGDALRSIRLNETDVVITGGSEAALTRMGLAAFQNMKALSMRNEEPTKASRPFDKDRDGFVLGEGSGVLVFEELNHALARGARIYGEVLGYGTTSDAGHITAPDPEGTGAAAAMSAALADAELDPTAIDYINAHGTSTPLGDIAETKAIKRVFGDHAYKTTVSSTKSSIGHSLGASGGIEAVILCKTLETQVIAPTINLDNQDPECDLDYTPNEAVSKPVKVAMSNSFGFGGHNACIVVGQYEG
ncbi:beta-ketoacyl-ACP synthase II [Rhodopirellula sp. MGV]|uniref:beta-ketoacyl-ACP synthase II n=1 Tax=Rhodopirellula sp. MGV TaxID=2023130 RepID=UPI000B96FFD6|nr:beta-ketoacyl-ACP synthase II [Rhodopirellula sp. MGV]OYP28436.1 beta-ketoacyl-[acyl-carrier-protein] synthase II [Rhodopirellula sp. MGV]PNY38688.1 beta-ketoacyl-[acyl-carrier-protein] synthase II [Rhodopirellula baltica]